MVTAKSDSSIRHMTEEDKTDLDVLAAQQGVSAVNEFDNLLGNFWPEDESADQFIAAFREWRREGQYGSNP
jgi:hypothetical protein